MLKFFNKIQEDKTRFSKIKDKDLSDYEIWHDANKKRYKKHDFWQTLDSKLIAWTYKLPFGISFVTRFFVRLLGTNVYEPFPIGNNEHVNNLWNDKPEWQRWFYWHLRNPWTDFRKFTFPLGFAHADTITSYSIIRYENKNRFFELVVQAPKFAWIPFKFPLFPYFRTRTFDRKGIMVLLGYKSMGMLGTTIKLENRE